MSTTTGTPRLPSIVAACSIVAQSDVLPMMIPTSGFAMRRGQASSVEK